MGVPQLKPEFRPQEQPGAGQASMAHRRRASESSRQAALVTFLNAATLPAIAPMPGARAPRSR
jgi:hypothetical protein